MYCTYVNDSAEVLDVVELRGNQLSVDELSVLEHSWVDLSVCVVACALTAQCRGEGDIV